ncbi:ATPase, F1/V1/A1 complex, alpha/beta subunit [Tanacetum coccineum]
MTESYIFVNLINKLSSNSDNKLVFKATDMSKEGKEYVVFDEELVKVGSAKWQLNVVGQCVGFRMSGAELSFPMKRVLCVKGISAIASSIGKPLIMDSMAANMCKQGFGRIDYARVLVEIDASKGFRDVIELMYKDKLNNYKGVKKVKVEYSWKPPVCDFCKVFRHLENGCTSKPRVINSDTTEKTSASVNEKLTSNENDGFTNVNNKMKNQGKKNTNSGTRQNVKVGGIQYLFCITLF